MGNVVGSCIFNIISVLGVSSLVSPDGIRVSPQALQFDIPVMIGVSIACLPVFYTGGTWFYMHQRLRYAHAIWHVFVLLGSLSHYIAVMSLVLRPAPPV